MANAIKGEVAFSAEGEDYVLLLDFNALCDLEDVVPGLMNGSAELKSPSAVRAVFHAGLAAHHADLTVKDAGRIIQAVGLSEVAVLIGRAMEASFPKADGKPVRPQKRQ